MPPEEKVEKRPVTTEDFIEKNISDAARSVFDGAAMVLTNTNTHKEDAEDAKFKRMGAKAIDTSSPFEGLLEGLGHSVINGDYIYSVSKSRHVAVNVDDTLEVAGMQNYLIDGVTKLTCCDDRIVNIKKSDRLNVAQDQTIVVLGSSSADYIKKHEVNAPTEFETKHKEWGITGMETKLTLFEMSHTATAIETGGRSIDKEGIHLIYEHLYEKYIEHRGEIIDLMNSVGAEVDLAGKANGGGGVALNTPTE